MQMHQLIYASCSSWGMQAAAPEVCKWLPLRYAEICRLLRQRCASCTSRDMQVDQQWYACRCSGVMQVAPAELCELLWLRYVSCISRDMQAAPAQVWKLLSRCLQAARWGMKAAPIAVEACMQAASGEVQYTSCSWDTQATFAKVLL
jgi:hypothetical protein